MHSGQFILGTEIAELEDNLAKYVGISNCITCANGTDALTLALKAWNIGVGDAVFVPDFTFFASAEAIALEGATPIFVDVDPQTFNIETNSLKQAVAEVKSEGKLNARAIVTVDLFGLPADYKNIRSIANDEQLLVLEDGAQGFGGEIEGQKACSFGDISTTSFFPAKPLGCYGDGGAIFTNNTEWADKINSLRQHGKGVNKYNNEHIGINSRLDALQAAILKVKFKAFKEAELSSIHQAALEYNNILSIFVKTPTPPLGFQSSWAQYTIQLSNKIERNKLQEHLKTNGIPTMIYYPKPLSKLPAFQHIHHYVETPIAQELSDKVLSLPIHPYITQAEISQVADTILSYISNKE